MQSTHIIQETYLINLSQLHFCLTVGISLKNGIEFRRKHGAESKRTQVSSIIVLVCGAL
jgi:hypothetical protein